MGKEQFSVRVPPDILQRIDELAAIEHRTRNNMLEVLVMKGLEMHELRKKAEKEALERAIMADAKKPPDTV